MILVLFSKEISMVTRKAQPGLTSVQLKIHIRGHVQSAESWPDLQEVELCLI